MSQDYAKRAAIHKQRMAKKNNNPVSAWLVIFTLVTLAAFAGFLYFLTQIRPAGEPQPVAKPRAATEKKTEKPAPPVEESAADDEYDFYKLLPQAEVIPPKVEEYLSDSKQASPPKTYLLQAGSFRSYGDADRLRAKLILEGLSAKINSVNDKQGRKWHRVLVGPFQSRSKLNQAQDILARANTESMLIELK